MQSSVASTSSWSKQVKRSWFQTVLLELFTTMEAFMKARQLKVVDMVGEDLSMPQEISQSYKK